MAPAYNHTLFGSQVTGGSTSVRTEWDRLAQAGATARAMLVEAAAMTWNISPSHCRTDNGRVVHPDGTSLTYGALAATAAASTSSALPSPMLSAPFTTDQSVTSWPAAR